MRYDDPSVFWDMPGFFYDMPEGAGPSKPNRMSKPKLDLKGKTPLQKVQKAEDLVTATTGNANFPSPTPPLATLTAKADAVSAAFSEREAAKNTLDQKQTALQCEARGLFQQGVANTETPLLRPHKHPSGQIHRPTPKFHRPTAQVERISL